MKLTLNEEVEMSIKANEYINSLAPKEETTFTKQQMIDLGVSNNIPELVAKIKRQLILKFIAVQIFLAGYLYLIVSIIGGSIYYNEWNNIANLFFIPLEIGYLIQFCKMLNKYIL